MRMMNCVGVDLCFKAIAIARSMNVAFSARQSWNSTASIDMNSWLISAHPQVKIPI